MTEITMLILQLIWFLIKVIAVSCFPFLLSGSGFFLYYYFIKGKRMKKKKMRSAYKKMPVLYRLFVEFPKRMVLDMFSFEPDKFPADGLHLFAGEQGSGKSIAAVELLLRYLKMYPMSEVYSNINLKFQDGKIEGWEDVVFKDNGIYGIMIFIDEIQNWFNSKESTYFPPEMIQEICQLRKQIKCIIGTSQVFGRVAKPIREQVTRLYKPVTFFGCLTVVRVYKPYTNSDGVVKRMKLLKMYFFVHNEELRNAYDTYEKVRRLVLKGFKPKSERFGYEAEPTEAEALKDNLRGKPEAV